MAERRMFSKRIIGSARFLRMPISSQALYFHLGMNADDDGVVEAFPVLRSIGCTEDDLRMLVAKSFVQVLNDDLVTYITDWTENNRIRADRKIDSIYKDLLIQMNPDVLLVEKRERADKKSKKPPLDVQWTTSGQPMDGIGKDRLGKDSIGEDRLGKKSTPSAAIDQIITDLDASEELKQTIRDFVAMRKTIRAPITDRGLSMMLTKLFQMGANDETRIAILSQSVMNSWKGIFPLHNEAQGKNKAEQRERETVDMLQDWMNSRKGAE